MYSKISETDVEKWIPLVDREREHYLSQPASNLTDYDEVQLAMKEDASTYDQLARDRY